MTQKSLQFLADEVTSTLRRSKITIVVREKAHQPHMSGRRLYVPNWFEKLSPETAKYGIAREILRHEKHTVVFVIVLGLIIVSVNFIQRVSAPLGNWSVAVLLLSGYPIYLATKWIRDSLEIVLGRYAVRRVWMVCDSIEKAKNYERIWHEHSSDWSELEAAARDQRLSKQFAQVTREFESSKF